MKSSSNNLILIFIFFLIFIFLFNHSTNNNICNKCNEQFKNKRVNFNNNLKIKEFNKEKPPSSISENFAEFNNNSDLDFNEFEEINNSDSTYVKSQKINGKISPNVSKDRLKSASGESSETKSSLKKSKQIYTNKPKPDLISNISKYPGYIKEFFRKFIKI